MVSVNSHLISCRIFRNSQRANFLFYILPLKYHWQDPECFAATLQTFFRDVRSASQVSLVYVCSVKRPTELATAGRRVTTVSLLLIDLFNTVDLLRLVRYILPGNKTAIKRKNDFFSLYPTQWSIRIKDILPPSCSVPRGPGTYGQGALAHV